jgi:hypothetical protein
MAKEKPITRDNYRELIVTPSSSTPTCRIDSMNCVGGTMDLNTKHEIVWRYPDTAPRSCRTCIRYIRHTNPTEITK